ncbi:MAG: hypothetical protein HY290_12205 [Planctomycetia bacterium]|nr:hypothetical protein [Planctomycetia bacterium]
MSYRPFSRRFIALALAASIALLSTSCGTILYPERRGQPPGGPLDPGVVILDALGLLFFVIPGVAAFIIDFSNGTIYLPPPGYGAVPCQTLRRQDLVPVKLAKQDMTRENIEKVVSEHVGRPVSLDDGRYRAGKLDNLEEFDERVESAVQENAESRPAAIRFP